MSDIFDELARTKPNEVGMELSQIFAPEFLDAYDAQTLKAAFGGLAKVMKSRSHPDYITNVADQAVVEKWRKDQHSEDPDVIEFNQHLLNGAALVDEFKKIEEQLEEDPTAARMSALLAIRQNRGYVPSRRAKASVIEEQVAPENPHAQLGLPEDIEAWRERQRALVHSESLTNVGEAMVLSRLSQNRAFLFQIEGRESRTKDKSQVKVQELVLLKPKETITKTWVEEALKRNQGLETEIDGRYAHLETRVDGGLFAKFNLTGPDANIGRNPLIKVLDEVNPQVYENELDYHPYNYQLAVKDYDNNYVFMPTARGQTTKKRPLKISNQEFNDWAISTYGELPDVLYVVNQGKAHQDRRVVFAFAKTSIEASILSPETFGLDTGGESLYIQPLGFVNNLAEHETRATKSKSTEIATPTDKTIGYEALKILDEDSDVLLLSGFDKDFIAKRSFHHRSFAGAIDGESGLVFRVYNAGVAADSEVEQDVDADGEILWSKVYAIKSPAVIGVTKESYTPNEALLSKWDEQTLEDLGDKVKHAMIQVAQKIIDDSLDI